MLIYSQKGASLMFGHIFKYSMLSDLRVKSLNFWILLFPIILGTLFSLAFGNFSNSEKFKSIPVAIVEEKQNEIQRRRSAELE